MFTSFIRVSPSDVYRILYVRYNIVNNEKQTTTTTTRKKLITMKCEKCSKSSNDLHMISGVLVCNECITDDDEIGNE